MPVPRVCVLRAPGTNCDRETAFAFASADCGDAVDVLHVFRLLESPELLDRYQILCLPGGFSYGDDVGSGVVFARHLTEDLGEAIDRFLARDTLVLGICNGFQVLVKAGILPGPRGREGGSTATLTWNTSGVFTDRWVRLAVTASENVFLRGLTDFEVPVAHAEGRLLADDGSRLAEWVAAGQAALCYVPRSGPLPDDPTATPLDPPENPNGSVGNLAGLGDSSGRVLGLMPHPERFLFATQHPQWTRLGLSGEGAGAAIFKNAVVYFA
ncbi:MAG: phosphoribosylformylglycinamidine synthase subunit PurQ [Planctomycetota bacterium]